MSFSITRFGEAAFPIAHWSELRTRLDPFGGRSSHMTLTQRIGKALTTRSSLIRRCLMCGRAARLVTKPLSLLWTELGPGHSSLHRWILRANGRAVWLRSRTSDLQVFVEIFCR